MADPSTSLGLIAGGGDSPLQDLNDDLVKLVAYNIVCLEYGNEQAVDQGAGVIVVVERMTKEQFVAFIVAQWLDGLTGTERRSLGFDTSMLDVHFVVVRRWPRRNQKFDEHKIEALEGIRTAMEKKAYQ